MVRVMFGSRLPSLAMRPAAGLSLTSSPTRESTTSSFLRRSLLGNTSSGTRSLVRSPLPALVWIVTNSNVCCVRKPSTSRTLRTLRTLLGASHPPPNRRSSPNACHSSPRLNRGVQLYPSCAQLTVTSGGSQDLPAGVAFPGSVNPFSSLRLVENASLTNLLCPS